MCLDVSTRVLMLVCMRVHGCWCVRVNMRGFVHYILTFTNIVVH